MQRPKAERNIENELDLLRVAKRRSWDELVEMVAEEVAPLDVWDVEKSAGGFSMVIIGGQIGTTFMLDYPFTWEAFWQELADVEETATADWEAEWESPSTSLELDAGQRLNVVVGNPGRAALGAYLAGEQGSFWAPPESFAAGDLLLTILDVDPPMLLCLERARRDGRPNSRAIYVDDDVDDFSDEMIPKVAIDARLSGPPLPVRPHTFSATRAAEILEAINDELADPTPLTAIEGAKHKSNSRHRSSGLQARVLAQSDGRCACCGIQYLAVLGGQGIAALEVHHLDAMAQSDSEMVTTSPERLVVLCGACHNLVHGTTVGGVAQLREKLRDANLLNRGRSDGP